ncbi:MAG: DUF3097 family protein, partial [Ilumatobacteraceae bacterium]
MRYERDILDEFAAARRPVEHPTVEVAMGLVVEDRASGFVGDVVRWNHEAVTLRDRRQHLRHFTWKSGGFLVDGKPVTLVRPVQQRSANRSVTASGSFAGISQTSNTSESSPAPITINPVTAPPWNARWNARLKQKETRAADDLL